MDLALDGYALIAKNPASYAALLLWFAGIRRVVRFEERELIDRFGDEYRDYARRVHGDHSKEWGKPMDSAITFWRDNRNCAGRKVAAIGDQLLVLYRERYFIVKDGAAQTRAGKTLRFSPSTLPTIWKKALNGVSPTEGKAPAPEPAKTQKPRTQKSTKEPAMADVQPEPVPSAPPEKRAAAQKPKRTQTPKPATPASVPAKCPYCSAHHDIPVERGKSGKPFFMSCSKCKKEFAVRFVPVTTYQAQVAGFN